MSTGNFVCRLILLVICVRTITLTVTPTLQHVCIRFGIRLEDILIVQEAKTPHHFGDVKFFCFENITVCPFQISLIKTDILSNKDVEWINMYHDSCWQKLSPLLTGPDDVCALQWLRTQTLPLV